MIQNILGIDKYDPKYTWHIIGHLQTNKVKYIVGKVDVIESLDSLKLAEEIEKQADKHGIIQKVLVELKISEDPNKTGYSFKDAKNFISQLQEFKHIQIKGINHSKGIGRTKNFGRSKQNGIFF